MSECVVLVRQARPEDQDARVTLVRLGLAEYNFPAFLYFFLQEVMLQFVLLCCAVLFIFFSTPLWICVLPGPALAIVTYIGCTCVHIELGDKHKRVGFSVKKTVRYLFIKLYCFNTEYVKWVSI